MLIDSHVHLWTVGEHGFEWPTPDLGAIYRSYGLADLEAAAAAAGVDGVVLVQSQPNEGDTDWLLALAEAAPRVLGVVGWMDLAAPEAPARIAALAGRRKLKGLRPMLQSLPQDDWIADPALDPALDAMGEAGLTLDALVFTRHLPALAALVRRRPELPVVIDHGAKPPIASGDHAAWAEAIAELAGAPQVYCKLSGLLTEAAPGQPADALGPYVAHLVRCFGPDRLMWGGDWPVVELRSGYAEWLDLAMKLAADAGADLDMLRHGAARRFYRL